MAFIKNKLWTFLVNKRKLRLNCESWLLVCGRSLTHTEQFYCKIWLGVLFCRLEYCLSYLVMWGNLFVTILVHVEFHTFFIVSSWPMVICIAKQRHFFLLNLNKKYRVNVYYLYTTHLMLATGELLHTTVANISITTCDFSRYWTAANLYDLCCSLLQKCIFTYYIRLWIWLANEEHMRCITRSNRKTYTKTLPKCKHHRWWQKQKISTILTLQREEMWII